MTPSCLIGDFVSSPKRAIMDPDDPSLVAPRSHGVSVRTRNFQGRETMAAMKPRTGDGPLEVTKEGRGIVLRMPLEGGGRLVVEMTPAEAADLRDAIQGCNGVS